MNIPVRIPPVEDHAEQAWEALRAECLEEFEEWVRADYDRREFEDFGNWLANKARWNAPNKYAAAMNWQERGPFDRAVNLIDLRRGHKAFVRNGGL